MNANIMNAYEKLEKVVEKTGREYQYQNALNQEICTIFYDEKPKGEYIIPQERVESDLKEIIAILMDFYSQAKQKNDFQSYDDFLTLFGAYCNFYIKKGFICRLDDAENTMFGLKKEDFAQDLNGLLLPYMEEVFAGIYEQDYAHFANAINIIIRFFIVFISFFFILAIIFFFP